MERTLIGHAVALLLSLAPAGVAVGEDAVSAAEFAAKVGAEEPEGKAFGESLGQAFGRAHSATIQRCAKETKRAELSDFALLLRVDGAGLVDQALVKPVTNLATCVQGKMVGWKATVPPHPGFWVNVSVNLKRK
jgi:hypothetical protein